MWASIIFTESTSKNKVEDKEDRAGQTNHEQREGAIVLRGPSIHRLLKLGPEDILGEALFTLIGDVNGLNGEAAKDRAAIIVRVAVEVMGRMAKVTPNREIRGGGLFAERAEGL